MTTTTSDAFQAAITFTVQSTVLKNLRNSLTYANPGLAEQGRFDEASDMLTFLKFPDLSSTTPQTPLTEGSAPTARAITMTTVTVSTAQYGDLVDITDIAKVKAPRDVVKIAAERTGRVAKEVMDTITRDIIFLGGTAFIEGALSTTNAARTDLGATEYLIGTDLQRLRATMKAGNVPLFDDGYYRLYVGNSVSHDLKRDTTASSSWIEPAKYTPAAYAEVQRGEIGILHGFRIIEADTSPTFSSTTTVHASLAVGAIKGWGAGELQTFKTYHIAPGNDHSDPLAQIEEVGWKMNFGVAVLNNGYYYRVESASRVL